MDFTFGPEEEQFRAELRQFFHEEVDRDAVAGLAVSEAAGPMRDLLKKMGARGWLSLTWPKEYGGQNKPATYRLIMLEEMGYFGLPVGGINTGGRIVAPTLILYGSPEQKQEYLPKIAAGEIDFALGYTEPEAGSDLAALQIRAVEDGDSFVISGQKLFNTACHYSEYHWLAARTDPNSLKHRGVSLFIVNLSSPGITLKPLWTIDKMRTNVVYYDEVRVPRGNLVGDLNRGFYYIATALSFERMFVVGQEIRILEDLLRYAKETREGQAPLIEQEWVRRGLAETATAVKVAQLLSHKLAWMQTQGIEAPYEASQLKLYATEVRRHLAEFAARLLGHLSEVEYGAPHAPLREAIARFYMSSIVGTIVGGTSEVQRNIIAQRGLALPR